MLFRKKIILRINNNIDNNNYSNQNNDKSLTLNSL